MNMNKVSFAFFIIFSLAINFAFFLGDIDNPEHHSSYELFVAIVVSLIATVLKFGERSQIGATLLATSLVADLCLICAALVWGISVHVLHLAMTPETMSSIVSLSGAALIANIISVILLVLETMTMRR
ncbi:MAG: DUF6394 family protein [Mariprofundaceae bacterium]|nr:DUF6394 family protein [Mariprofundaceae bacterium]